MYSSPERLSVSEEGEVRCCCCTNTWTGLLYKCLKRGPPHLLYLTACIVSNLDYGRLQWQKLTHDRPDLSSERAPQKDKTVTLKKKKFWSNAPYLVSTPRHTDCQSQRDFDFDFVSNCKHLELKEYSACGVCISPVNMLEAHSSVETTST
jgi:hypothetical protein